jgi:transcriptional antiterminator NusG
MKTAESSNERFRRGDRIRVMSGPFSKFEAIVDSGIDWEGKVRITISIFGRDTQVEVYKHQIEKVGQ